MLLDYHVHSTCSGDCPIPMGDMCARAVEIGITEICFTEHFDNHPLDMCFGMFSLERFRAELRTVRDDFCDRLTIRSGIEFGEPHLFTDKLAYANGWDLDVLLGSVHWVDDTIVALDQFADADMDLIYRAYFDELLKTVTHGGFDVMAHFDLVKRFGVKYAGPFDFPRYRDRIAAILEVMVRQGIALEVNTSGLRQPCKETFPGLETLKLYRDLGGELVTIGSDSHRIVQLGFGLSEGMDLIRQAGFPGITTYQKRQPLLITFDEIGS